MIDRTCQLPGVCVCVIGRERGRGPGGRGDDGGADGGSRRRPDEGLHTHHTLLVCWLRETRVVSPLHSQSELVHSLVISRGDLTCTHHNSRGDIPRALVPSPCLASVSEMMDSFAACGAGVDWDVGEVSNLLSDAKMSTMKKNDDEGPPDQHMDLVEQPRANSNEIMAQDFAIEHRIFLKAILGLLNERDAHSMEGDSNGCSTKILKVGYLRKASRRMGRWRTRYVELRKGTFSYTDGADRQGNGIGHSRDTKTGTVRRKEVHLSASSCECRPMKHSGGSVFELSIEGGSRRLWMADTPEERLAWIRAIHDAMIGASVTRGDNFLEYQVEQVEGRTRKEWGYNVPPNSP